MNKVDEEIVMPVQSGGVEVLPLIELDLGDEDTLRYVQNLNGFNGGLDPLLPDLRARIDLGERKYGRRLHTDNGRPWGMDVYQEYLDAINYLRGAIATEEPHFKTHPVKLFIEGRTMSEKVYCYILMYFKMLDLAAWMRDVLEKYNELGTNDE